MCKKYFDSPTQVMFWDEDNHMFNYGIAYRNEIICGCCGGVFEVEEILNSEVPAGQEAIYTYETWADISEEIFKRFLEAKIRTDINRRAKQIKNSYSFFNIITFFWNTGSV